MYWHLILDLVALFVTVLFFRQRTVKIIKDNVFWVCFVTGVVICLIWDTFSVYTSSWGFPGEYVFGVQLTGFPIFEELLFVFVIVLVILCVVDLMRD